MKARQDRIVLSAPHFLVFSGKVLTKNKQNFLLEPFPKKEGSLKFTLCD